MYILILSTRMQLMQVVRKSRTLFEYVMIKLQMQLGQNIIYKRNSNVIPNTVLCTMVQQEKNFGLVGLHYYNIYT